MKQLTILIFIGILAMFSINACTDSTQPEVHSAEWMEPGSNNFHGVQLLTEGLDGIDYCRDCHGENLDGGNAGVSCDNCHTGGYSGHPGWDEFVTPGGENHHGSFFPFSGYEGLDYCKNCHGDDLQGGFAGFSCYQCHSGGPSGHPAQANFLDPLNDQFHGLAFSEGGWTGIEHCRDCHGTNLDGGVAETSCYQCHAGGPSGHPDLFEFSSFDSTNFHGNLFDWEADTGNCTKCHGDNLDGGVAEISCRGCHPDNQPVHIHDYTVWVPTSENFHGNFGFDGCRGCHGEDYSGGMVGYSCLVCHPSGFN